MDENQEIRLKILLEKYIAGQLEEQGLAEMYVLLSVPGADELLEEKFMSDIGHTCTEMPPADARWEKIWETVQAKKSQPGKNAAGKRSVKIYRTARLAVAASLLLALFSGGYFLYERRAETTRRSSAQTVRAGDILPGTEGAVLHLGNGEVIDLNRAGNGTLAIEGNTRIVKENGALKYEGHASGTVYNDITTGPGHQWHFRLPDGSGVWLNASSSIHYPVSFSGRERLVEITGEAYFEVVHNAALPFKVKAGGQIIEDIGTAFNVAAYDDEASVKTTLLSGKVNIMSKGQSVLLKPGQQAVVNDRIKVEDLPDAQQSIAWKNGMFAFCDADIPAVMKQMARWYNVDIVYDGNPASHQFTGNIPKNMMLSEVLKVLEQAGVHFKISTSVSPGKAGRIIVEQ